MGNFSGAERPEKGWQLFGYIRSLLRELTNKAYPKQWQDAIDILRTVRQALRSYVGQGRIHRRVGACLSQMRGKRLSRLLKVGQQPVSGNNINPHAWGIEEGLQADSPLREFLWSIFCSAPGLIGSSTRVWQQSPHGMAVCSLSFYSGLFILFIL